MKRSVKITVGICVVVLVLVAAVALAVSPVVKNYVEKHSKELIGRSVSMEALKINIFNGSMRVNNLVVKDEADRDNFLSLHEFYVRMSPLKLLSREVLVKRILLDGADIEVTQQGNRFNFSDIIEHFPADTAAESSAPSEWIVNLNDINISSSRIYYRDLEVGADWDMKDLALHIPGIYFAGENTDVGINLDFAQGGSLSTQLKYNMDSGKYDVSLKLNDFSVAGCKPYLSGFLDVGSLEGLLCADVNIAGDIEHVMGFNVNGRVGLSGVTMEDSQSRKVFAVDTAYTDIAGINMMEGNVNLAKLCVDGFSTQLELYEDGTNNFSTLMVDRGGDSEAVAGEESDGSSMNISIGTLDIRGGKLHFCDNSLAEPFQYDLSDIRLRASELTGDMAAKNSLIMSAVMNRTGSARIKWTGSLADMNNQDITLLLSNINLSDLSPYSVRYFGYPLIDGNLSLQSQNVITDRCIKGTNTLDMYRCEVAKKDKSSKPEYNIPLKLGLYVLKDKKDHINIDLPVSGNLDSPEFSYRKIILRAFGNVLLKVATAPFSFMAGSKDGLEAIDINPVEFGFSTEQYVQFDQLAKMIKEKPEVKLSLTQNIVMADAAKSQALEILRREYYMTSHPEKRSMRLEMLDVSAIREISLKGAGVAHFADSLAAVRGVAVPSDTEGKAVVLFAEQAREEITRMAEMRNTRLNKYFVERHALPADAVKLSTEMTESVKGKAKHRYVVSAEMDGDDSASADAPVEIADNL